MGWRVVLIETPCKLAYKNNYLLIRSDKDNLIYIPEIDILMINTTQIVFTGILLTELVKNKVKIIFSDEKHNPNAEIVSLCDCHNSSRKIYIQTTWQEQTKQQIFTKIIAQKIKNQSALLKKKNKITESEILNSYINELQLNDITNREGFSAKVYFNALFGKDFNRDSDDNRNSALNYGYSLILSYINREIVKNGYLTQLGIHHFNEYNHFNLSCDLIEPFRVIVDEFVCENLFTGKITPEYKHKMAGLFSKRVRLERECFLSDAIEQIIRNNLKCISENNIDGLQLYDY